MLSSYVSKEQFTKTIFTGRYNAQTKRLVLIESSAQLQYTGTVHSLHQDLPADLCA